MGISAASAVRNARAAVVTHQVPQGKCLNWVWRMFGSLNSTGYAAGSLQSAMTAWNASRQKHGPSEPVPIGAPVYFGVSPSRTDANKYAGDVTIHIGGGILACTDASGANTGFMTIAARARQTARPYIGWCGDFGGRAIDFGVRVVPVGGSSVVIIQEEEEDMPVVVVNTDTKTQFAISREALHGFRNEQDANTFRDVTSVKDELHRLNSGQLEQFLIANGIPGQYARDEVFFAERGDARSSSDPEAWKASRHADWSLQTEVRDRLVSVQAALSAPSK